MVNCDPFLVDFEDEDAELSGVTEDGAFALLGNALEAWSDCRPEGYLLPADLLQTLLPDIARYVPGSVETRETSEMLEELFVPPPGEGEQALFYKMLKARDGRVHFLYFWRAFSQAARLLAQLRGLLHRGGPGERLAEELETLRDAVLRLLELKEADYSRQSLTMTELADVVRGAMAMSSAPEFWKGPHGDLQKPTRSHRNGRLSIDEVTIVLLSWMKEAAVWQPPPPPEEPPVARPAADEDNRLPVLVHIYHVSHEEGVRKLNRVLAHRYSPIKIGGIFHAGVEVNGLEWAFGMSESEFVPGIACTAPKAHPMHRYRQTIKLRPTKLSAEEVAELLTVMIEEYPGDDYDLLRRNCCNFADDFARRLGAGRLPGWVHRLARVGALVDGAMQRVANRSLLPDEDDDW